MYVQGATERVAIASRMHDTVDRVASRARLLSLATAGLLVTTAVCGAISAGSTGLVVAIAGSAVHAGCLLWRGLVDLRLGQSEKDLVLALERESLAVVRQYETLSRAVAKRGRGEQQDAAATLSGSGEPMSAKILRELRVIAEELSFLRKAYESMSPALQALADQVTASNAVAHSAVTLIQGLAAQIAAGAGDASAMTQLAADLHASSDSLSAAITANTPSAPPAPPPPAAPTADPTPPTDPTPPPTT